MKDLTKIIDDSVELFNPDARYLLSPAIICTSQNILDEAQDDAWVIPGRVTAADFQNSLYKDLSTGDRVYVKMCGDILSTLVVGKGDHIPNMNDEMYIAIGEAFNVAYQKTNMLKIAQKVDTLAELYQAFKILYRRVNVLEILDKSSNYVKMHQALHDPEDNLVYDKELNIIGVSPKEYRKTIEDRYWINGNI